MNKIGGISLKKLSMRKAAIFDNLKDSNKLNKNIPNKCSIRKQNQSELKQKINQNRLNMNASVQFVCHLILIFKD